MLFGYLIQNALKFFVQNHLRQFLLNICLRQMNLLGNVLHLVTNKNCFNIDLGIIQDSIPRNLSPFSYVMNNIKG